ncbi:MAG: hypothetical protein R6V53_04750 [Candidatus Woesearchaeota archaeon]
MRLEKIIATALVGLSLVGCSTTNYGGNRIHSKDYTRTRTDFIPKFEKETSDMDTYMRQMERFLEKNHCIEDYKAEIREIDKDLSDNKFDEVQYDVRSLVNKLERQDDQCSGELKEKVKGFNYIRYQYIAPEYQEKKSFSVLKAQMLPVMIAGNILDLGVSALSGSKPSTVNGDDLLFTTDKKKLSDGEWQKVLVNPYSGKEKYID